MLTGFVHENPRQTINHVDAFLGTISEPRANMYLNRATQALLVIGI